MTRKAVDVIFVSLMMMDYIVTLDQQKASSCIDETWNWEVEWPQLFDKVYTWMSYHLLDTEPTI